MHTSQIPHICAKVLAGTHGLLLPTVPTSSSLGTNGLLCQSHLLILTSVPPPTFTPAGWCEGERLRDAERGWFPTECTRVITCQATIEKNMERMGRLLALETHAQTQAQTTSPCTPGR